MKTALKIFFAAAISVLFVVVLFQFVNLNDILSGIWKLSPEVIFASLLLYLLSYVIRALRFRLLLPNPPKFSRMLGITALHTFFVVAVPFRLGELSYLYFTRREEAKIGHGLSSLAISRVFDVGAVAVYFVAGALFAVELPSVLRAGVVLAAAGFALLVGLLLFAIFSTATAHRILHFFVSKLPAWNWIQWLADRLHDLLDGMSMLRSTRVFLGGFMLSLALWAIFFIVPYFVFTSLGLQLPVSGFVLATAFQALSAALPIQGILGFGTIEAGWTLGLVAIGIKPEDAISSSFAYHIMFTVFIVVIAAFAWMLVRKKAGK